MASPTTLDPHPGPPEIHADLQDVAHVVHQEFDDRLDPRVIDECLGRVAGRFTHGRVRSFVPLLVLRYVREELQTHL